MKLSYSIAINKFISKPVMVLLVLCLLIANIIAFAHNHKATEPEQDQCLVCQHIQLINKATVNHSFVLDIVDCKAATFTLNDISFQAPTYFHFKSRAPPV